MYSPGKLIYFDPFEFDNGEKKSKYFLVLKILKGNVVMASLPSSKSHLPPSIEIEHGCLEIPDSGITCYIFKAHRIITRNGWAFPLDTFMHGLWLDDYPIDQLKNVYQIENVDYEIIGDLTTEELTRVIDCFKKSTTVKRKYKKALSDI